MEAFYEESFIFRNGTLDLKDDFICNMVDFLMDNISVCCLAMETYPCPQNYLADQPTTADHQITRPLLSPSAEPGVQLAVQLQCTHSSEVEITHKQYKPDKLPPLDKANLDILEKFTKKVDNQKALGDAPLLLSGSYNNIIMVCRVSDYT